MQIRVDAKLFTQRRPFSHKFLLSIETIDNKKIRSKRKLVLDNLFHLDGEMYEDDLIKETGVSKKILNKNPL